MISLVAASALFLSGEGEGCADLAACCLVGAGWECTGPWGPSNPPSEHPHPTTSSRLRWRFGGKISYPSPAREKVPQSVLWPDPLFPTASPIC